MEKKIEIQDGKVVVYNDNGVYSNGETTTSIKGEYNIAADDVLQLITLLDNNTHVVKRVFKIYKWGFVEGETENVYLYTKDEDLHNDVKTIIDEYNKETDKCRKELDKYSDQVSELKELIKQHNESLGFFGKLFGKKIDISNLK